MAREIQEFQAKVTADTKQATKDVEDLTKKLDAVEKADTEVKIHGSGADQLLADLHELADAADDVDQSDPKVSVDVDEGAFNKVKGELDDVHKKGEGLTGGAVNSIADLTGPLGDVSQNVNDFGQAFVGAAEIAGGALEGIGVDVGKLAGVMGAGGVALGAILYFWKLSGDAAADTKAKYTDVLEAMSSGDIAGAAKGIVSALQPWRKIMDDVGTSVGEATKFITGQTDVLPIAGAAVDDHTSKQFFLRQELERQRQAWADNHSDLATAQLDQFNATRAVGGTTDAFLAQAKTALPEVQQQILAYVAHINGIPPSRFTEITTDADPDDVKQVEDEINNAARDRTSTVNVDADTTALERTLQSTLSAIRNTVLTVPVATRQAMAGTPYAAGGVYRVGEAGPENVYLPRGARVDTAGRTMMGDGGGQTVVNNNYTITVNVPVGTPTPEVGRFVADALDAHERRSGSRRRVA